ncbi:MAG: hypothetical protein HY318_09205 [Armatimonadetes bacterium]|nr:hypothetical protein [Armatimonadota bacterium]
MQFQQERLPNPLYVGTEDAVLIEGSVTAGEPEGESNFGMNTGIQMADKGDRIKRMRSLLRFNVAGTARVEKVRAARLRLTIRTADLRPAAGVLQILVVSESDKDWVGGRENGRPQPGACCWRAKAHDGAEWKGGSEAIGDASRLVATVPINEQMADGEVVTLEFPDWMLPVVKGWFDSREKNAGLWFKFKDDKGAVLFNSANSVSPGEAPVTARPLLEVEYEGSPLILPGAPPAGDATETPRPARPLTVGAQKQLFIDHRFIESSENITLVLNPPVKRPEPVLRSDKPWDAFRLIWFSVAEDQGMLKMWYQAFDNDQWGGGRSRLCYSISRDGINWEKPRLGLVEFNGSRDNNILRDNTVNGSVLIDPHGPPEQRYKLLFSKFPPEGQFDIYVATSADGIHWNEPKSPVLRGGPDTQHTAFWDTRLNKYVVFLRVSAPTTVGGDPASVWATRIMRPGRAVGRIDLDDILAPWPAEKIQMVLAGDELDPEDSDIYTHPPYQYPFAADAYLMFPLTYQHFRAGETPVGNDGVNDTQLAVSRDGIHWMRSDRRPYVPRGLPGEPDCGMTQTTCYMFRKGNYLYHYYAGWPYTHGGFRRLTPEERADPAISWGRQHYGLLIQRLDGFMSADAPYTGGWLVTPPVVFDGNRLELNIDVAAMGLARVEIQDEQGKPIPGYSLEECDRILFNDVAYTVKWRGKSEVSSVAGKPVRLKFFLRSAKLYAFQFRREGER